MAGLTAKVRPDSSFLNAVSDQKAKITFHHCTWGAATEPPSHFVLQSVSQPGDTWPRLKGLSRDSDGTLTNALFISSNPFHMHCWQHHSITKRSISSSFCLKTSLIEHAELGTKISPVPSSHLTRPSKFKMEKTEYVRSGRGTTQRSFGVLMKYNFTKINFYIYMHVCLHRHTHIYHHTFFLKKLLSYHRDHTLIQTYCAKEAQLQRKSTSLTLLLPLIYTGY